MKTITIESKSDLVRAIDKIGSIQDEVAAKQAELKSYMKAARTYIDAHPEDKKGSTDLNRWHLKASKRAVRVLPGFTRENVVDLMEDNLEMAAYIVKDFDAEAIRDDFGGNAEKRKSVHGYGLHIDEPKFTLAVEGLA